VKFKDEQGSELEYTPLQDRLIKAGFDKSMLDKDESLIAYRHNPKTGLIGTLKNAFTGLGHLNIPVFQHYSRKHRRRNPVYIEITEIIKPGEWIAFTPSVQIDKDTSLSGKMDSLTFSARLFTKFVRLFTGRKDKPIVESTYIFGINSDDFKFSQGYYISGVQYYEGAGDYIIILKTNSSDEDITTENTFLALPDILGKTDAAYISS
jgi:hypothetical protein